MVRVVCVGFVLTGKFSIVAGCCDIADGFATIEIRIGYQLSTGSQPSGRLPATWPLDRKSR